MDNSYTRDPNSFFPSATIASYSIDPDDASKWIRPPYRELTPSEHPVDQLIAYSNLYYPIRFDLRDHRHRSLQPLFDDPEYDPNLNYDPPLRNNTPPSVAVEGADDDPTTRVWTEIEVIDPLDPSLATIIVRTSQNFESSDDDEDLISDILPPAEDSLEDNASSDIDDPVEHLPSDQEDVPPLIDYPSPVPRDDPSA